MSNDPYLTSAENLERLKARLRQIRERGHSRP